MLKRLINPINTNSFFLFGARATGKSTLLKQLFSNQDTLWLDLLDPDTEQLYALKPAVLSQELAALREQKRQPQWVVIDEVQKLPKLLDIVHHEIEANGVKFALTGSSARKLRHGAANLLAGRAFVNHLFPLTAYELGPKFKLDDVLNWGSLPKIFQLESDRSKAAFLRAYAQTYIKEEIWGEHLIRKLDPFRKFLEIAAQTNGQIINYTNIARDVATDSKTVQNYYEILEDTLLGMLLPAFDQSIRKQQNKAPKFYFFDIGVQRALQGILTLPCVPKTYAYGRAFEHFVILEIARLNSYLEKDLKLSYLRTKDDVEIDLIIEHPGGALSLIEIKSSNSIDDRDTRSLERFCSDFKNARAYCFSLDPLPKKIGEVSCFHWQQGLKEISLGISENES
jgi:predicted AAA+ superfamily ATPase